MVNSPSTTNSSGNTLRINLLHNNNNSNSNNSLNITLLQPFLLRINSSAGMVEELQVDLEEEEGMVMMEENMDMAEEAEVEVEEEEGTTTRGDMGKEGLGLGRQGKRVLSPRAISW